MLTGRPGKPNSPLGPGGPVGPCQEEKQCVERDVASRPAPGVNSEASADTHLNPSRSRQPVISLSTRTQSHGFLQFG